MDSSTPDKPESAAPRQTLMAEFGETLRTLVFAIVFAVVFRSFAYEPFHIPSDSMKSNLLVGDYLFVSKFSYGYSRYSFPFFGWPTIHGRFLEKSPKRGDIIVFRPPGKPSEDYIKRLIGMPGDRIQMKSGVLNINGQPLPKVYVDDWTDPEPDGKSGNSRTYLRYRETMPNGKSYLILNAREGGQVEDTKEFVVPEGHYFMMGDNRDDSRDSRYLQYDDDLVGYVPAENLVGRADIIMFSWHDLFSFRTERFFKVIP
jgi:signal peptidase I